MEEAKIHLSGTETELMCNAQVILTKNMVLHKMKVLMESIEFQMQLQVQSNSHWYSQEVFGPGSKISKGENYQGLPYLVLDYPRQFDVVNIFAIRTMFWWGNFFSSTLHLTGDYKTNVAEEVENAYELLAANDYYIGVNEDQWAHHFEEDNYRSISELTEEEFKNCCRQYDHLKIAVRYPLWEWEQAPHRLLKSWTFLLNTCFPDY